jgi:DNA-binding NarL/FixJ family response regulator
VIRVLLVDDNASFGTGMARLLATIPDLELCGTAADGATGVSAIPASAEPRPSCVCGSFDLCRCPDDCRAPP